MDMEQNAAKIKYCDDLSSLGFGLDELRKLKDALLEIAKDRDSGSSVDNATDILKLFFKQIEEFQNLESRIESLKKEKNGIEEARKMLINDLRDFIEQTKKDVKEVSDLAIQAIKMAQKDKRDAGLNKNRKDIT